MQHYSDVKPIMHLTITRLRK